MTKKPLDFLLIVSPNLREQAYLVGAASLKAYLQHKGFQVDCLNPVRDVMPLMKEEEREALRSQFSIDLDFMLDTVKPEIVAPVVKDLIQKIGEKNPRFLGFSVIQGNIQISLYLAKQVKMHFPHLPILVGGPGMKSTSADYYQPNMMDYVVRGEAEDILEELFLLPNPIEPNALDKISGLEYLYQGKWHNIGIQRPTRDDLTGYPQPDYTDFEKDPISLSLFFSKPISLGRGCPFRCRFCAVRNYGKNYRHYSIETCLEFIRHEIATTGNNRFFVHDPISNGNPHWLRTFCKAILDAGLKIEWGGNVRLVKYLADTDILDLMVASGFRSMIIGLESAAPNVLRHMRKFDEQESVNKIFDRLREIKKSYDFQVLLQLIVGYPNETEEDFQMTLDFTERYQDVISEISTCSAFLMIKNDDLEDLITTKEFGIVMRTEPDWSSDFSTPTIRLDRMNRAEKHFQRLGMKHRMFYKDFLEQIERDRLRMEAMGAQHPHQEPSFSSTV